MNKTNNLKLNVWEKTDPILVGDFNEDNRKIDAAVGSILARGSFEKIQEIATTESMHTLNFDLRGIDWRKWQMVRMDLTLVNGQGGEGYVKLNNSGTCQTMSGSSESMFLKTSVRPENDPEQPAPIRMMFLPMGEENQYVRALAFGLYGFYYCYLDHPYRELKTLTVSSDGSAFRAGCKFSVYGMR